MPISFLGPAVWVALCAAVPAKYGYSTSFQWPQDNSCHLRFYGADEYKSDAGRNFADLMNNAIFFLPVTYFMGHVMYAIWKAQKMTANMKKNKTNLKTLPGRSRKVHDRSSESLSDDAAGEDKLGRLSFMLPVSLSSSLKSLRATVNTTVSTGLSRMALSDNTKVLLMPAIFGASWIIYMAFFFGLLKSITLHFSVDAEDSFTQWQDCLLAYDVLFTAAGRSASWGASSADAMRACGNVPPVRVSIGGGSGAGVMAFYWLWTLGGAHLAGVLLVPWFIVFGLSRQTMKLWIQ